MEFSRQEYWTGLLFSSPGDLPYPGIEPVSPTLQVDSLSTESSGKPSKALGNHNNDHSREYWENSQTLGACLLCSTQKAEQIT